VDEPHDDLIEEESGDEASGEMNADEAETLTGSIDDCGGSDGYVGEGPCAGFDRDTGGTVGREASEASEASESSESSEREESVDFGV